MADVVERSCVVKQVCVIGLGQFGSHIARRLVKLGCEVLALDVNEQRVDDLRDDVHRALIADARSVQTLKSVLAHSVDEAIICLGELIEPSILCTLSLKRLEVPTIRATATNDDHAEILRAIGATEVIFPERETAERTARRMANPDLLDDFALSEDYSIMKVVAPAAMHNKSLLELSLRKTHDLMVLAVKAPDTEHFSYMPGADTVIKPGEVVMLLGRSLDLAQFTGMNAE